MLRRNELPLLLFFSFLACGGKEPEERVVPVEVAVVEAETISRVIYAPCRLEAGSEAVISAPQPSLVEEVLVESGDTVRAGDRLLALKTDDMRHAEVASAAAMVEAARASSEYALSNLSRAETLFEEGAMSIQQYQAAETEALSAEASYAQARAGLSAAITSAGSGYVTAPFAGVIGRIAVTEGNPAAGPLLTIFSGEILQSELLVSPVHLLYLEPGLPAVFTTDHYPGEFFQGTVQTVATGADPVSGLASLTVQISDTSGRLIPGLSGMVMVALETHENVPVLGENAMKPLGDCCWEAVVVRHGRAEFVRLQTGISNGTRHEVISGIQPGDSVVTLGHTIVNQGEEVRVVER